MYCHNCGAQIPDGSKFCNSCGANVELQNHKTNEREVVVPHKGEATTKPEKQRKGGGGKAFLCIFLLLLILTVCWVFFNPDTRDLYVYSKASIYSEDLEDTEFAPLVSSFEDTYLFTPSGQYLFVNLESGLGFSKEDIDEVLAEFADINISEFGSYAFVEISDKNSSDKVTITYSRANIKERLGFLSKYIYWK